VKILVDTCAVFIPDNCSCRHNFFKIYLYFNWHQYFNCSEAQTAGSLMMV